MSEKQSVQTIEKTSKKWKGLMVLGVLITTGSCASVLVRDPSVAPNEPNIAAGFGILFGVAVWVFAKVGKWWNHA